VGRSSARAAARLTALASRPGWPGRGRPGASPAPGARGRASGAQGVRPPGWTGPAPGGHVRFAGPPGELHKPNRRPVSLWCTAWLVTPRRAASCCQDQPVARALATCRASRTSTRPPRAATAAGPTSGPGGWWPPPPGSPRWGPPHPWRQSTLTPAGASTNIDSPCCRVAGDEAASSRPRSSSCSVSVSRWGSPVAASLGGLDGRHDRPGLRSGQTLLASGRRPGGSAGQTSGRWERSRNPSRPWSPVAAVSDVIALAADALASVPSLH
jgi:hypothetical protein